MFTRKKKKKQWERWVEKEGTGKEETGMEGGRASLSFMIELYIVEQDING